jgi:hypothetical protein
LSMPTLHHISDRMETGTSDCAWNTHMLGYTVATTAQPTESETLPSSRTQYRNSTKFVFLHGIRPYLLGLIRFCGHVIHSYTKPVTQDHMSLLQSDRPDLDS